MIDTDNPKPTLIGFGEAATALTTGWTRAGIVVGGDIRAFDVKTDSADPEIARAKRDDYRRAGISGQDNLAGLLQQAHLVFSLVTADQALPAAAAAALYLPPEALYLDCNSCAPDTKRRAAELIESAGGRYVDVAIMGPVHPALHRVPLLISGPRAAQALPLLRRLDMDARDLGGEIGAASTIKMLRSIMVKGLEALGAECMLAAHKAGVDSEVLDSLDTSFPGFDWRRKIAYMLRRSLVHGRRRAVEMREVANCVTDLGLDSDMARASSRWQQRLGDLGMSAGGEDCDGLAERVLAALEASAGRPRASQPTLLADPETPLEKHS